MTNINISHKKLYEGTISKFSSEISHKHSITNILQENGFWRTHKSNSMIYEYFIIDYKNVVPINFIHILPSPEGKTAFPIDFRIEGSIDCVNWMNIHYEKDLETDDSSEYILNIPITFIRYIKVLITKPRKVGTKYFSDIGRFLTGISGIKETSASSISSFAHDTDKLIDNKNDTFWESELIETKRSESLDIDLGQILHINRIILISPNNYSSIKSKNYKQIQ